MTKGMGRAALMIRVQPDSAEARAELLRACRLDLRYDRQCEEPRAPYMYRLIRETGDARSVFLELENWLLAANGDDEETDFVQVFSILCSAAADDPSLDRKFLRDFLQNARDRGVIGPAIETGIYGCGRAFIALEGFGDLLFCARRFYAALLENAREEDGWVLRSWIEALEERDGAETTSTALRDARGQSLELDQLMSPQEGVRPASSPEPSVGIDYPTARAKLRDPKRSPPRDWIKSASPEDLELAADDLLSESDDMIIWRYLWIFRQRDFPRAPRSLFHLLDSSNLRVAHRAADVLGRIRDAETRALALEWLSTRRSPDMAIELLRNNFQSGDFERIERRLENLALEDADWHGIGFGVFQLIDENEVRPEEFRPLLFRLYEQGPCSLCRTTIVSKLLECGGAPDWMAEECRFDAKPETMRLFT